MLITLGSRRGCCGKVNTDSVVHKADHLARLLEGVPTRVDGDNVRLASLKPLECVISERARRYPHGLCQRVACQNHLSIAYAEAVGRRHTSRNRCAGCRRCQELESPSTIEAAVD